jgi:hypothetical protein
MMKHAFLGFVGLALLAACGDDGTTSSGGTTDDTTSAGGGATTSAGGAEATGGGGEAGVGGMGGMAPVMEDIETIAGDITWTVTFDTDAQTAGQTNCTYTRHYEAVEDESAKWLCPTCDVILKADVEMTAGKADCFSQVSPDFPEPATLEWIGFQGDKVFRGGGLTMGEFGTQTTDANTLTTTNQVLDLDAPKGGKMQFDIAGSLTKGTVVGDPMHGFYPPAHYKCGWHRAHAEPYTGDYTIVKGKIVPDGLFKDACDETVRLHELSGKYLVIDMSARDCPPCQAMAKAEEGFKADMAAKGIEVEFVTLMAPSLSDPLGETTTPMLQGWINKYSSTSPVIADRGWGLSMFVPAVLANSGEDAGYPSWVVVAPDLTVLDLGTGYGSMKQFQDPIEADHG